MKRPNILLITSDQQHYSMLGSVNPKLKTPNLDRLAAEGALCTRAYCPNPTCTPSRSSILTGMYPSHHGAWTLGTKLPETMPTLNDPLHDQGYQTALIGKAHFQPLASTPEYPSLEAPEKLHDLEFWKNYHSGFYGFDHIELLRNHTAEQHVGQHYALWMEEKGLKDWRKYFFPPAGRMPYRGMGRWKLPEEYHYNTWIAERTNAMLEEYSQKSQPFFLWASFPDPHYPQLVPAPWDRMYRPKDMQMQEFSFDEHDKNPPYYREVFKRHPNFAPYRETGFGIHGLYRQPYHKRELQRQLAYAYGMVSFMDKYIGKILDKLRELDLEKDTIIVFTTDHGDMFGQHGLRHKCIFHYEDLLKIPMIVKYAGHIPAGSRIEGIQSLIDLAPTFLSLCGIPVPEQMDGVDESTVWTGQAASARGYAICENRHEPHTMNMRSYMEERYKITVHDGRSYGELFDLQNDPEEHNNLWDSEEHRVLKAEVLFRFALAELAKAEGHPAHCTFTEGGFELQLDRTAGTGKIFNLADDPERKDDLWLSNNFLNEKIRLLLRCITCHMAREPMPMPRIASA